jgi:phosphoglycolate phosphatase
MIEVVSGDKPGIKRKPAPDGVEYVLKQLDCEKNDAVYVGDSEIDILTARNAGVDCISVTWGFRTERELLDNGAVNLIFEPNELLRLLEKL